MARGFARLGRGSAFFGGQGTEKGSSEDLTPPAPFPKGEGGVQGSKALRISQEPFVSFPPPRFGAGTGEVFFSGTAGR
jgi:hypothetical protein